MNAEKLLARLADDPIERLRWCVCREFRMAPFSKSATKMNEWQVVMCGAHMVLDRREKEGAARYESAQNTGFDGGRFEALSEAPR